MVQTRGHLPFVRTDRSDQPVCKYNGSVLPNWGSCSWVNWSSLRTRVSLARNSLEALHLQTCQSNGSVLKNGKHIEFFFPTIHKDKRWTMECSSRKSAKKPSLIPGDIYNRWWAQRHIFADEKLDQRGVLYKWPQFGKILVKRPSTDIVCSCSLASKRTKWGKSVNVVCNVDPCQFVGEEKSTYP